MGNLRPMSATPPASVMAESHQRQSQLTENTGSGFYKHSLRSGTLQSGGVLRNGRLGADLLVEIRSTDKKIEPMRRLGQDNAIGSAGHRVGKPRREAEQVVRARENSILETLPGPEARARLAGEEREKGCCGERGGSRAEQARTGSAKV